MSTRTKSRSSKFDKLRFADETKEKSFNMANNVEINVLVQQMATLQATMQTLMHEHTIEVNTLKAQIQQLRVNPLINHPRPAPLEEVSTRITNVNEVKLEVFKSLPTFDGDITRYRVWREDTSRMMDSIEPLKHTSIYSQALQIVKTKIQGAAAQVLANHGTIFNFDAIRSRLDYTYADTRPLYVLQEEMKRCYQGRKTLEEFHDEINKSLSLIISKISMSGYVEEAIDAMTVQAKQDSVRVFIAGVNNTFIQSTLYSNSPQDLEHAYTIARTIEHDSKHQNLKLSCDSQQPRQQFHQHPRQQFHQQPRQQFHQQPRQQFHQQPRQQFHQQSRQQFFQQPQQKFNNSQPRPEPMDISSGNTTQRRPAHYSSHQYNHQPWKRRRESSGNFQQVRNNNITTEDDTSSLTVETGIVNKLVVKHLN